MYFSPCSPSGKGFLSGHADGSIVRFFFDDEGTGDQQVRFSFFLGFELGHLEVGLSVGYSVPVVKGFYWVIQTVPLWGSSLMMKEPETRLTSRWDFIFPLGWARSLGGWAVLGYSVPVVKGFYWVMQTVPLWGSSLMMKEPETRLTSRWDFIFPLGWSWSLGGWAVFGLFSPSGKGFLSGHADSSVVRFFFDDEGTQDQQLRFYFPFGLS